METPYSSLVAPSALVTPTAQPLTPTSGYARVNVSSKLMPCTTPVLSTMPQSASSGARIDSDVFLCGCDCGIHVSVLQNNIMDFLVSNMPTPTDASTSEHEVCGIGSKRNEKQVSLRLKRPLSTTTSFERDERENIQFGAYRSAYCCYYSRTQRVRLQIIMQGNNIRV